MLADRAFVYSFRQLVPSRGCMSGFDYIPAIPIWLIAVLVGLVGGAMTGSFLLRRFWAWQACGRRQRHHDDEWV